MPSLHDPLSSAAARRDPGHDDAVGLHRLFERQAARRPEAVALVHDGQRMRYAELNARANRLAQCLIDAGAGPDRLVAFCAQRGFALPVAALAALKAGAAYLPFDPAHASARLASMLADAAPTLALCDDSGRRALGEAALARMRCFDPLADSVCSAAGDDDEPAWAARNPRIAALRPHHLAYVIYTSGSTGAPKGVMVEHRNLLYLAATETARFGVDAHSRIAQFASPGFDASVLELVMALANGAELHLATPAQRASAEAFNEWFERERLTHALLPPAFLQGRALRFAHRPVLMLGGEAPSPALVRELAGQATVINAYGPTEITVCATQWIAPQADAGESAPVPIGRALAGARVYLLDADGRPVARGETGEIHIGGDGVARGYLGRPELSAERFLADPFAAGRGARMYRSGDLARELDDGSLLFLGRNDHQLKLRGYRIEPGEIQARLGEHPQVRECAVLAREGAPGETQLVGYYTGDAAPAALRAFLAARLPDYMLPAAFVALPALPLTGNGKLDRAALPAPGEADRARARYRPPQGEDERALARLWSELLGLERIGRDDDFFALGGHSLTAARLRVRVRERHGVELPMAALFDHPTLAAFAAAFAGLRAQAPADALPPIEPAPADAAPAVSHAQRRLWFLHQLEPDQVRYNMPLRLDLDGELDVAALRRSLDALFARHQALRTVFASVDGEAQARLLPAQPGPALAEHDLCGAADAAQRLHELCGLDARTPFDLTAGPLIRARLIRTGERAHTLMLVQHHIVCDGWSLHLLGRELGALYAAHRAGAPDPLPPLRVQYPDYAAWEQRWLHGERLAPQADYWRDALAGAPALLALPTDRPRPPRPPQAAGSLPLRIDAERVARLQALCRAHGCSLFMAVAAAWSLVLARLSGQDEVVIGTPSANRERAEIEPLLGFFVNTLALRVDVGGEADVAQLLQRVRAAALGAQANQDLPFEQVVEIAQPERRIDRTPLFQALLAWQSNETGRFDLPGLHVRASQPFAAVRFELELHLREQDGELVGELGYASELFDAATVERQLRYLRAALDAFCARPRQPVARIDLIGADERAHLLEQLGRGEPEAQPRPPECVHRLFERQARATPQATALIHAGRRMDYAELDARAERLARRLRALGTGPDQRVGLCARRGFGVVVGALAALKAGAAYVPLDLDHPRERLAQVLADAAPVAVLADAAGREALAATPANATPALDLDAALADALDGHVAEPAEIAPQAEPDPQHLAYVIYTSGSTGAPKGVAMPHAPLAQLLHWQRSALAPARRVLQFAALGFDVAFQEIFGALCGGAALVLLDADQRLDLAALPALLRAQRIDRLHLPYIAAQGLAEAVEDGGDAALDALRAHLREIVVAGEQLRLTPQLRWLLRQLPDCRLHNHYGPTETHVAVACALGPDLDAEPDHAPIGRPVSGSRVYLLDRHGQPVPRGAAGELYLAGACVARGYLHRRELESERFLADPFAEPLAQPSAGARMYRTGDLARFRADGRLEFLGRNDQQVKIRGFRIEPGEIEARLAEHAQVRECAVLARERPDGQTALVAYAVPAGGEVHHGDDSRDWAAALRAHLAARLPDYMLPSAFVAVPALPVTPNGKLDARALPAPDAAAFAHAAFEAPRGASETALAKLWQELLGLARVGRGDHFFELGGHSLIAVRLLSRIGRTFAIELPLAELFARPRLADLAAAIDARLAQAAQGDDDVPGAPSEPILPRGENDGAGDGELPLSLAQQRLWFLSRFHGASATYHIPLALRLRGALDTAALRRALDRIFARHEGLRSVFPERGGIAHARLLDPRGGVDWVQRDLRGSDAQARLRERMDEDVDAPFDLAHGPLLRARLSRLDQDTHVLLLVVHHIVADGWSLGVLMDELSALYAAFAAGRADPLPPLPVQYPDYAIWQRRRFAPGRLRAQADYWRGALAGAPALLELPLDRPRPPQQSFAAGFVPLRLDAALTTALKRVAQRHGATVFMTVLAAWSAVLARLSGQDDVVIGAATAGRNRHETEPLIGFFVNTLALRIDLSGAPGPAALLARARKATLDAQAHQDLPFEQVVDALQLPRRLDRTPVFQAMFAWQSDEDALPRLPGVEAGAEPLRLHWAKFDLELVLGERDGGVEGGLNYACALFDPASVERHRDYLLAALAALAAQRPDPVAHWPLLPSREREALVNARNRTEMAFDRDGLLDQAFARQARRTPQADAVVHGEARLSYAELDRRADRLAHRLVARGVVRGDRVALGAQRGFGLIVGILAILKAGAAYVPFDPAYPSARLARILADAAPALALCDAAGRAALEACARQCASQDAAPEPGAAPRDPALPQLDLDDETLWSQGPTQPPQVPGRAASDLAYLIYTSGSTGAPKGVMVEHRNAMHLAAAQARRLRTGRRSRVLQFASIGFDASVFDLLMAFGRGGALYLPDPADRESAPALLDFVRRRRITHATLPPALLQGHAIAPFAHRPTFLLGGEAPSPALVLELSRHARVINAYGPTEITVCASAWTAPRAQAPQVEAADAPVPIGRPLPNVRLYLLDAQRQPVPTGAVGELYIGGAGVARGYFGRPDLTAERFLADPFDPRPGARMYRSGDLARYLPDGELLFLGRNDEQIKLRGFRIEPAEIQAHLDAHPAVRECAVIARQDRAGESYLAAYVVADPDRAETGDEVLAASLRAYLSERLPDYMRPAAYVRVDALPLTAHGKLDRRALPAPGGDHFARAAYQPPRPGEESRLAELWRELLDVQRIGRHDDFFELGGHSLRAVQLAARLDEAFGVRVPVRELFAHPRLDEMAALLISGAQTRGGSGAALDLDAEARLEPDIDGAGLAAATPPARYRELLLTGATGFLGAFLLQALLQRTQARVHCLVRCADAADGRRRLDAALAALGLRASDPTRVAIVPGDLAEPRLGLDARDFAALAERIDAIYHNGAWVNSLHGYAALKPANVGGTREVVRLASSARRKHVHYVSTLSTLPAPAQVRALGEPAEDEEALARCWRALGSGYARSKWVAERLLRAGGERGLPFTVYRPTHIAGAADSGACNASDAWSLFVQACYRLGAAPDIDLRMSSLAVDRMAAAIVELSLRGDSAGRSLNLADAHGYRLADWIDCVLEQPGMAAARRPYAQWLRDCAADPATAAVASILPAELAPGGGDEDRGDTVVGNAMTELLDPAASPPLDREHLRRCAHWLYRHRG
ncbi:amino acid adenylation domain-containing protein [Lysobacter yananisis]|uniref:Amino acid adenylation domain-containing protein n=1 Tax=Lysobacter yananisis TaxID=1003114 RepID=A0ABY9P484_9GAMM|nr:non-ribosomal peptide synthetase [Lysobacter yananisis]WMT01789.1 amino acid adenylation domain-containing protein [Lysobacter yananisis]